MAWCSVWKIVCVVRFHHIGSSNTAIFETQQMHLHISKCVVIFRLRCHGLHHDTVLQLSSFLFISNTWIKCNSCIQPSAKVEVYCVFVCICFGTRCSFHCIGCRQFNELHAISNNLPYTIPMDYSCHRRDQRERTHRHTQNSFSSSSFIFFLHFLSFLLLIYWLSHSAELLYRFYYVSIVFLIQTRQKERSRTHEHKIGCVIC